MAKSHAGNGNGNGSNGNGHSRGALRHEGTSPLPVHRLVVATHSLETDEYAVALFVDGRQALTLPAVDWDAAQEKALQLLELADSHINRND